MQAQRYAEVAAVAEQNGTWCSWIAQLKKQLHESTWPSTLVVVNWEKHGLCEWPPACDHRYKRGEKVLATNKKWLELFEYTEDQVIGKKFRDIEGFQGPLTTEVCKLHLVSLLVTERPSVKGLQVVNYTGQTKKAIILQENVDILRWHGQNMAFLCSIVGFKDALHVESPIAGSGRQAIVGIIAARAEAGSIEAANANFLIPLVEPEDLAEDSPEDKFLPRLWKYLLDNRSEPKTHVYEMSPEESGVAKATCAVCCDDLEDGDEVRILSCSHRFHASCVDNWFSYQLAAARPLVIVIPSSVGSAFSCPVCKQDPLGMSKPQLEGKPRGNSFAERWLPSFMSMSSNHKALPRQISA
jgi:hypothetical protein